MSIKYAVLALIAEQSQHGYAVRKAFEERLGDIRDLGYGQVYQVLASLRRGELITGEETLGTVRRIVYTVTPSGESALREWLSGAELEPRRFQDDIFLRLLFMPPEPSGILNLLLERQIRLVEEDLEILREQYSLNSLGGSDVNPMQKLYTFAEILHREADVEALREAVRSLRPGIADGKTLVGPASKTWKSPPERGLKKRNPATTFDNPRVKSRYG